MGEMKERVLRGDRCVADDLDMVVGAGAVVTRDLPAGVLAVGNPARVLRVLTPEA